MIQKNVDKMNVHMGIINYIFNVIKMDVRLKQIKYLLILINVKVYIIIVI